MKKLGDNYIVVDEVTGLPLSLKGGINFRYCCKCSQLCVGKFNFKYCNMCSKKVIRFDRKFDLFQFLFVPLKTKRTTTD